MDDWVKDLKASVQGEVHTDDETLDAYSTDASIFKVKPRVVVFPKDSHDVKALVKFAKENKSRVPTISVTARAAGTDMTGGPLTESIVVAFAKHINKLKKVGNDYAIVEPGMYYRDFEKETMKKNLYFPSYPASKSLCGIGGIINNNSGGEKTLTYGKTNKHVRRLKIVLADGNEYEFKRINKHELDKKMAQKDFEGHVYREVYNLIEKNYDAIQAARPQVPKNSAGYYLWNVWDKEYFDMIQLIVGAQGTLGFVTEAELDLVKKHQYNRLVTVYLRDIKRMAEFVNMVLPFKPESLEAFDDKTMQLGIKFMPGIAKKINKSFLSLFLSFWREGLMVLRHGPPKFIILIELTDDDEKELNRRLQELHAVLQKNKLPNLVMKTEEQGEKYWIMRRQSFALLREKVKDKKATPFIDDFDVLPQYLPEFLPKLYKILKDHGIKPTLAGHAGSGNFHIIPLMDLNKESERAKIPVVSEKVYDLVNEYHGSITAEHNDGLIRTPYLKQMFGDHIYSLFEKVKEIFDPDGIFNPGKKVHADLKYAMEHINASFVAGSKHQKEMAKQAKKN